MNSRVMWTVALGLPATLLATAVMAIVTHESIKGVLGWAIFFALLQIPIIDAARQGRPDPCSTWLRRVLLERRNRT